MLLDMMKLFYEERMKAHDQGTSTSDQFLDEMRIGFVGAAAEK